MRSENIFDLASIKNADYNTYNVGDPQIDNGIIRNRANKFFTHSLFSVLVARNLANNQFLDLTWIIKKECFK